MGGGFWGNPPVVKPLLDVRLVLPQLGSISTKNGWFPGGFGGDQPIWAWVKIEPPGYGPQVLVHASIYQGNPF